MPSKSYLMGLESATDIVDYAVSVLGVNTLLKQVVVKPNGVKEVILVDSSSAEFSGSGASKKEACAEAISNRFPVGSYPDPS